MNNSFRLSYYCTNAIKKKGGGGKLLNWLLMEFTLSEKFLILSTINSSGVCTKFVLASAAHILKLERYRED